jgi:purine-binding chemotaxis protein CheW
MTAVATRAAKIVSFRLGDDLFAADIFSVERVLRYQQPTAVPNVPAWIEGVIEYQARVIPVVNLRRRFELPVVDAGPETRILVLRTGTEWVGIVVDAVLEVTSFQPSQLSEPPDLFRGLAREYLKGIIRLPERLLIFLDVERMLSTEDRLVLQRATAGALPNA